jgi:putative methyltransferase (TIGR04325 family)
MASLVPGMISKILGRLKSPSDWQIRYSPEGWQDFPQKAGWNAGELVQARSTDWKAYLERLAGTAPLGFKHTGTDPSDVFDVGWQNLHLAFGYALGLAAQRRSEISILDWGGGLGQYYWLSRALYPELKLKYACKEMPAFVEAGRELSPQVEWTSNDQCLSEAHDLILMSGSLQYERDWKSLLARISSSQSRYFYLTRLPVALRGESYASVQTGMGSQMMLWTLSREDLLATLRGLGWTLVREIVLEEKPEITDAPEPCVVRGFLLGR